MHETMHTWAQTATQWKQSSITLQARRPAYIHMLTNNANVCVAPLYFRYRQVSKNRRTILQWLKRETITKKKSPFIYMKSWNIDSLSTYHACVYTYIHTYMHVYHVHTQTYIYITHTQAHRHPFILHTWVLLLQVFSCEEPCHLFTHMHNMYVCIYHACTNITSHTQIKCMLMLSLI